MLSWIAKGQEKTAEMAQWLRLLAAILKDLSSIPSIYMEAHIPL